MLRFIKVLLLSLFLIISVTAENRDADSIKIKKFSVNADLKGFLNNLEYFNDYRKGILLLGGELKTFFKYKPVEQIEFTAGVYMRRAMGDEDFLTDIRPVFRAEYNKNAYTMTIGDIHENNRHNLPDAIISEQYVYEKGMEDGIQFQWDYRLFKADLWMSTDMLNTPEHREHFLFGFYNRIPLKDLNFESMIFWDHFGGQLYFPEGDYMRDAINGSVALKYKHSFNKKKLDNVGGELRFLASSVTPNRSDVEAHRGVGGLGRVYVTIKKLQMAFQFYKGDGFESWLGNEIYKTDKYYYFLELSRSTEFAFNTKLEWGLRFDFVDITPDKYFDHTEHQVWVNITSSFGKDLF